MGNPSVPASMHQPSPGPSQSSSGRHKQKNIPVGITAGAEDVKYQTKYKDLKRKVKDIENDNDKLHFKILQAKRNIQRMKLERAILYERLATVPPSPPPQAHHPLPGSVPPSSRDSRHSRLDIEADYPRGPPPRQPEPRSGGPILETPIAPGALQSHSHRSSRRADDHPRGLPHHHHNSPQVHDLDMAQGRSNSSPHGHAPVPPEQSRSHSSSRSRQQYQQYADPLPPMNRPQASPPPDNGRSRRMDISELAGTHGDPHRQPSRHRSPDVRGSRQSRPVYDEREEYLARREREREADWERERDRGRDHRVREPSSTRGPYVDHISSSRTREDSGYPHDSSARHLYSSRAGSPSPSGGMASDGPSRPDSRSQAYDRSYPLRPVHHDEREEVHVREVSSRPMTYTPHSNQGSYPPKDWDRIDEARRPQSQEIPMDVDSGRTRRAPAGDMAYSPETRRYYDSDHSPDAELPRGYRAADLRPPEDDDRPTLPRMES